MKKFSLSPSTLNLYSDCPRCFWFHMIKGQDFRRPEPPTSTLPSGMDSLIKKYFDKYRQLHLLPPEVSSAIKGKLVDERLIKKWRFWRTGLEFIDEKGNRLSGALDECIVDEGFYIPVDYKTRGFDLKNNSTYYYLLQMSCYVFLLANNGYKVCNFAYLIFYIPQEVKKNGNVNFKIEVKRMNTLDNKKVFDTFNEALAILSLENPPQPKETCKFCRWVVKVSSSRDYQPHLF